MIPNNNRLIYLKFKKQPLNRKWFVIAVVFSLWIQLLMGVTINFEDLEPGKHGENNYHVWVYFKDKNDGNIRNKEFYFSLLMESMNHRTIQRRKKVKSLNNLVDEYDIPVSMSYIESVKENGVKIRTISRWLNAVSVDGTFQQIELVSKYSFVKKIEPVLSGKRREIKVNPQLNKIQSDSSFYGNSYNQLNQINVIQLHESGYSGENVRVLVLDSGFFLDHEVFDSLNVVAAYDFVDQDSVVSNEAGKDPSNQHNHGTQVLSVLAGFKPETLIGSAYGAEFLLGKTEDISLEEPIEEDNYIVGLEWGESLGADILSSSIGYIDWYSQNDLDGSTARITQAVNIAIELGMVVVTAVGNSGPGGIVAPADAFDVISCGAVDENEIISSFSSRGPTADGRIKPEVCAQGNGTFSATAISTTSYGTGIGTSLAAPLVSGTCALLLEAHPHWTPAQIRNAILNTADQSNTPDNTYGWGIVDAFAAFIYDQTGTPSDSVFLVSNGYPNPCDKMVSFTLINPPDLKVKLSIIDVKGSSTFERNYTLLQNEDIIQLNLKDYPTGVYMVNFDFKQNTPITRKICHIRGLENPCTE